jgi:hypothetical protein
MGWDNNIEDTNIHLQNRHVFWSLQNINIDKIYQRCFQQNYFFEKPCRCKYSERVKNLKYTQKTLKQSLHIIKFGVIKATHYKRFYLSLF